MITRDHCDSSYPLVLNLLVLNEHLRLLGHRDHCDSWTLFKVSLRSLEQFGVSNRSSWEASDLGYSGIANKTIGVSSLSVLSKLRF